VVVGWAKQKADSGAGGGGGGGGGGGCGFSRQQFTAVTRVQFQASPFVVFWWIK